MGAGIDPAEFGVVEEIPQAIRARAQAACKGRATYVPRIGDQSPRFMTREWTFELQKASERWTIASARSL